MKKFSMLLLCLFLLAGCNLAPGLDTVRGSGDVVRENRPVDGAFTRIVVASSADLTVVQGNERAIEVEAEENILPELTETLSGDTLTLGVRPGRSIQTRQPIRYTITLPEVEGLRVAGSGDVQSEGIRAEELELEIAGSGDLRVEALTARTLNVNIDGSGTVTLAGDVQAQVVDVNGSGDYDAVELVSERATVAINGSGTATVYAAGRLSVEINGSGDVLYYGNPQVEQDINGSGDLRQGSGR